MKKIYFTFILLICFIALKAQHTLAEYKTINAGTTGFGDYTETMILLHEMYNGDALNGNYAIGTITALRGSVYSYNRTNIVQINTASSYNATYGSAVSSDYAGSWQLKTCLYNGKKYLAGEVP